MDENTEASLNGCEMSRGKMIAKSVIAGKDGSGIFDLPGSTALKRWRVVEVECLIIEDTFR